MGFSYGRFGLCCDFCGHDETEYNVVKIACPYGYCQSWACCKYCKAKKKHLVCSIGKTGKSHKEICKPLAQKFDQEHPHLKNLNTRMYKKSEVIQ